MNAALYFCDVQFHGGKTFVEDRGVTLAISAFSKPPTFVATEGGMS